MKHLSISCQEAEIDSIGNKTRIKMHGVDRDFLEDFSLEDLKEIISIHGVNKILFLIGGIEKDYAEQY